MTSSSQSRSFSWGHVHGRCIRKKSKRIKTVFYGYLTVALAISWFTCRIAGVKASPSGHKLHVIAASIPGSTQSTEKTSNNNKKWWRWRWGGAMRWASAGLLHVQKISNVDNKTKRGSAPYLFFCCFLLHAEVLGHQVCFHPHPCSRTNCSKQILAVEPK